MNFHEMVVKPMSEATIRRLIMLDGMAGSDPRIATLIKLWNVAEQANRRRFSASDMDSSLVNYCKVVEQVANAVDQKAAAIGDPAVEELVADLTVKLTSPRPIVERVKSIEAIAQRLRELKSIGSRRRLARTLETLDVHRDLGGAVLEVWDLRSRKAGHPNPTSVTDTQVDSARAAAGELLTFYFNWRWRQRPAPPPRHPQN